MALLKDAGRSLAEQLTDRFAERIGTGLLAPGARLPSVRQCAGLHGVSTSTVVAAYDRLLALGLVQARPQRGFFVREAAGARVGAVAAALSVSGAGVGARADALDSARARVPVNAAALPRWRSIPDRFTRPPTMKNLTRTVGWTASVRRCKNERFGMPS